MLTNVFLCLYHLPAHSHFARPPQYVPGTIEELEVGYAAVTAGLSGIRTVELHQAALQGLHQPCFHIWVAQDVVRGHQALSGIVKTGPSNALCSGGNLTVLVHVTWVLASQYESDRCESSSCNHSDPASLFFTPWALERENLSFLANGPSKVVWLFLFYLYRTRGQI